MAQQLHTSRIEPLRNEKWWGYFVSEGPRQPFEEGFGTRTDSTAIPVTVPLMASNKGRYIWSEYPFTVTLDNGIFTITSDTEHISPTKSGNTLREAYLSCIHKHIRPTETELGLRQPVYTTTLSTVSAADETRLLQLVGELAACGIDSGTILIPDGWRDDSSEDGFDKNLYSSFRRLAGQINEYGFDVMLTVTPLIPAAGYRYAEARRNNQLVSDGDGKPIIIETPRGWYACLDISRSEVCTALQNTLSNAVQQGNIKFYFNCDDVAEYLTDTNREIFLANWSELARSNSAVITSRSTPTMLQWHPYSIVAEKLSWEGLGAILSEVLCAGITGHIYPYLDLSSVDPETDEELMLRALQIAAFMPIPSIETGCDNPQYSRTITQTASMSDYMTELKNRTSTTGEPIIRLMEYQFPNQGFANCDDQFMIGSEYLVAPILNSTGRRMVRLPKGIWIGSDGTKYKGPRVIELDVTSGETPVFRLKMPVKIR